MGFHSISSSTCHTRRTLPVFLTAAPIPTNLITTTILVGDWCCCRRAVPQFYILLLRFTQDDLSSCCCWCNPGLDCQGVSSINENAAIYWLPEIYTEYLAIWLSPYVCNTLYRSPDNSSWDPAAKAGNKYNIVLVNRYSVTDPKSNSRFAKRPRASS